MYEFGVYIDRQTPRYRAIRWDGTQELAAWLESQGVPILHHASLKGELHIAIKPGTDFHSTARVRDYIFVKNGAYYVVPREQFSELYVRVAP